MTTGNGRLALNRSSPDGRELGRQGRGNPKTRQNGVVKSGYRADTAAGEGENQHAAGAGDPGQRVLEVHDQRGLA